jgi:hypothetical protein
MQEGIVIHITVLMNSEYLGYFIHIVTKILGVCLIDGAWID